jgi:hypothetical protein
VSNSKAFTDYAGRTEGVIILDNIAIGVLIMLTIAIMWSGLCAAPLWQGRPSKKVPKDKDRPRFGLRNR